MKKNTLQLITGTNHTKNALHEQLTRLFDPYIRIDSFSIENGLPDKLSAGVILLSSLDVKEEIHHLLDSREHEILAAVRSVNAENLEPLLQLPDGANVLTVNDTSETAAQLIEQLHELGMNHVNYVPYQKEKSFYETIDLVISPGEMEYVPKHLFPKLDIGVRLIGFPTIFELARIFNLTFLFQILTERHMKQAVQLQRKLSAAARLAKKNEENLQNVVNQISDGLVGVHPDGTIALFNTASEAIFQIAKENVCGRHIMQAGLPPEAAAFIYEGTSPLGLFRIGGMETAIDRNEKNGLITAAISHVSKAEEINKEAKTAWEKKGFSAKYTFDQMIGDHPAFKEIIAVAKKLALSDLPVLIEGETGTGKEMFAQAIHNGSKRRSGPFVAVNCSALPPALLESELFGYEAGAFTGANKGGKKGLFEQAEGGTLFLDEIGDVSSEGQASLLRVLQEKEIRRISGTKNIPIDVRIVAATNMNLMDKMDSGHFRTDLYYRLNVLSIQIPPLRDRRSDIPILAESFLNKSGKVSRMHPAVMEKLLKEPWEGNIRELKNTIDYMLAVSDGKTIQVHDIPGTPGKKTKKKEKDSPPLPLTLMDKQEFAFILETIRISNENGEPASRRIISEISKTSPHPLTAQQVRHRLDYLEKHGYVTKGRGRAGTKITLEGLDFLHSLQTHLVI
ncbi:sigma 54-interacting transcriptional regulator [Metabacillus sp. 84]|uniref:sigma 54-interacting transcriptional regulator n=1 Tax=unclassified Metabacillus TaxID=2675274 RepID=UPI003CECC12B